MKKRCLTLLLTLVMLVSVFAAACAPASTDVPGNNEPSSPVDKPTPQDSALPSDQIVSSKDTLTVAIGNDTGDMNPHGLTSFNFVKIKVQCYETLFQLRFEDNAVLPLLATGYEWLDDTSLKITLRQGVQFHNGFGEMTAEDVMFSLEKVKASSASYPLTEVDLEKSEIVDDYTVILRTYKPYSPLLNNLTNFATSIFSKKGYEQDNGKFTVDIGTGAYVYDEWNEGESVVQVAFPEYWGEGPFLSKIVWKVIDSETSRAIELETGGCDLAYDVSMLDKESIEKEGLTFQKYFTNDTNTIHFNMEKSIFSDPTLRKALAYSFDRVKASTVAKSDAEVAMQMVLDMTHPYAFSNESEVAAAGGEVITFDLQKAKQLFEEAGYYDPARLNNHVFKIRVASGTSYVKATEAWASDLASIGVKTDIVTTDFATYVNDIKVTRDFEIGSWGTAPVTGDWDYFALHYYGGSPSTINISQSKNAEFDALVEEYRATTDDAKRREIALEAQLILYNEYYAIPMYETVELYAHSADLVNFNEGAFQSPVLNAVYFK